MSMRNRSSLTERRLQTVFCLQVDQIPAAPAAPEGAGRGPGTWAGTFSSPSHLMFGRDPGEVDGARNLKENGMKVHLMALTFGLALAMPALAADQVEKAPPSGAY